jgi:hypothetical protein
MASREAVEAEAEKAFLAIGLDEGTTKCVALGDRDRAPRAADSFFWFAICSSGAVLRAASRGAGRPAAPGSPRARTSAARGGWIGGPAGGARGRAARATLLPVCSAVADPAPRRSRAAR